MPSRELACLSQMLMRTNTERFAAGDDFAVPGNESLIRYQSTADKSITGADTDEKREGEHRTQNSGLKTGRSINSVRTLGTTLVGIFGYVVSVLVLLTFEKKCYRVCSRGPGSEVRIIN